MVTLAPISYYLAGGSAPLFVFQVIYRHPSANEKIRQTGLRVMLFWMRTQYPFWPCTTRSRARIACQVPEAAPTEGRDRELLLAEEKPHLTLKLATENELLMGTDVGMGVGNGGPF